MNGVREARGGDGESAASVGADSLLDALPAGVVVVDALTKILHANAPAAVMVGRDRAELVGSSAVDLVSRDTSWAYATAVAMASEYSGVVMGPLRIELPRPDGRRVKADLWATNHLDDPRIGGIVCLLVRPSVTMGLGDAVVSLAAGQSPRLVVNQVLEAIEGSPLDADAALLTVRGTRVALVGRSPGLPDMLVEQLDEGPWFYVAHTGYRSLFPTCEEMPEPHGVRARDAGYGAMWVEPVTAKVRPTDEVLVLWRRIPGNPSPNELRVLAQVAAVLTLIPHVGDGA
ncbi:MAG: hypothetical protein KatS3mg008_1393 [Acidimicrobiales bacterium]|nr:MAG: hypothetical protein KatS3mg008_1393 [Acidimicrobiales bacterium]